MTGEAALSRAGAVSGKHSRRQQSGGHSDTVRPHTTSLSGTLSTVKMISTLSVVLILLLHLSVTHGKAEINYQISLYSI